MLLSDLLQVLNTSNFVGIHELTTDGNSYDMIYTGQIKTKKELDKVIKKYGKREVIDIHGCSVYNRYDRRGLK